MKPLNIFKPAFVSLFLILALESLQILLSLNYYPNSSTIAESLASVALVLIFLTVVLVIVLAISSWIVKRSGLGEVYLLASVEILSVTALLFIYTPAGILTATRNYPDTFTFFWQFGYGIIPAGIFVGVISLRILLANSFKRIFYNIVNLFWKPSLVLTIISLVWTPIIIVTHGTYTTKAASSQQHLSAVEQSGQKKKPNVILITFDALSATDMSLHGYNRRTTPYWEDLAKESYVFQNMHSNYERTIASLLSILTSKYPWTHGAYKWLEHLEDKNEENIATQLGEEYYTTAIVPSAIQHPEFLGLKGKFDYARWANFELPRISSIYNFFPDLSPFSAPILRHITFIKNIDNHRAYFDEPFKDAEKIIRDRNGSPIFMWIHLWPPHPPHLQPAPFTGTFLSPQETINMVIGPYTEDQQKDVDKMRASYNEAILYTDNMLKSFVESLKESGLYDDSILIVTSDHGTILEQGFSIEPSPFMYEPLFHIPLLIHLPGQRAGYRVEAQAEHVDLAPTILELVDKPIPQWMEGESLVPYMNNPTQISDKTNYAMVLESEYSAFDVRWFSAYRGDYKIVYHMDTDTTALFNIKLDYQQKNDLARTQPSILRKLKSDLNRKIEENYSNIARSLEKE